MMLLLTDLIIKNMTFAFIETEGRVNFDYIEDSFFFQELPVEGASIDNEGLCPG